MKFLNKKALGMSLVELLVGAGIFVMVMAISASAGLMIYKGKTKIQYTNTLYLETRFMMERMIRDVRVNTIDYYEYFSQNLDSYALDGGLSEISGYGKHPGLYEMFFYFIPSSSDPKNDISNTSFSWANDDRSNDINVGVFNTNADDDSTTENLEFTLIYSEFVNALEDLAYSGNSTLLRRDGSTDDTTVFSLGDAHTKGELFLLSSDGLQKTIYRYNTELVEGEKRGFIEIAKMKLEDTDSGSAVKNEWIDLYSQVGDADYPRYDPTFVSVTPPSLSVTNFSFILSPRDDPKKSFAKAVDTNGKTVQIQPHVVLKITAKLSEKSARGILGENNEFTLQSSASSRVFHNVTFPRQ